MARQEQQITVALLQTMIGRVGEYTPGYFDVVIADECHRSIYGAWQTALTRFDATHVGLTATPANYIERNTYDFYQCELGQPDFSYPIQAAFREDYLAPYSFASGITEILAEAAADLKGMGLAMPGFDQDQIPSCNAAPDEAVTVSIGASVSHPDDTVESIVRRTDELMYKSKQNGRNRVTTG